MCGRLFLHRPHNKRCMRDCIAEHKYAIRTRNCDRPTAPRCKWLLKLSQREAFWIHRLDALNPLGLKRDADFAFSARFSFCMCMISSLLWMKYIHVFFIFFLLSIVLLYWLPCLPFWGSSDCLPFPGDIIYRRSHTLSFACWALMPEPL